MGDIIEFPTVSGTRGETYPVGAGSFDGFEDLDTLIRFAQEYIGRRKREGRFIPKYFVSRGVIEQIQTRAGIGSSRVNQDRHGKWIIEVDSDGVTFIHTSLADWD